VLGRVADPGSVSGLGEEPEEGICNIYSSITGKKPNAKATSSVPSHGQDVQLFPSWPASSPWVTSVGSTRFVNQTAGQPEMATDQFGSGGGFSTMFDPFDGEKADIAKYFKVAPQLPPAGMFPRGGRATPDVAALGEGFQVVIHGRATPVGGTSASAPTFAGLVSLLNEARLAKKMAPMGFLNPWLYKNADAFTDITRGDNFNGRSAYKEPYGFNCTAGWDPVTGLGSPLFDKMLSAASHMRDEVVV
jgi:tripeptidyl-peptidase-1